MRNATSQKRIEPGNSAEGKVAALERPDRGDAVFHLAFARVGKLGVPLHDEVFVAGRLVIPPNVDDVGFSVAALPEPPHAVRQVAKNGLPPRLRGPPPLPAGEAV